MLNITPQSSAGAAKTYFAKSDYYMADTQEILGHWGGKGAVLLGLFGEVDKQSFDRLCDNLHPETGDALTAINRGDRRVGYDFTWSAPKSVSVMHALTGDERIVAAFRESIRDTMGELEQDMQCRVRKGGKDTDRKTGNLVYSEFIHLTSRPVDGVPSPQLHSHCFAANVTWDPIEDIWKAGQFGNIKASGYYWQGVQQARFANRLQELGYPIRKTKDAFEIDGVPQSALPRFSLRTALIEKVAKERGITDPKIKATLAVSTREGKNHSFLYSELKEMWNQWLTPTERQSIHETADKKVPHRVAPKDANHVRYAAEHLFERSSVVDERRLLTLALRHGVGEVSPEGVRAEMAKLGLLKREEDGQVLVTTKQLLAQEQAMLQFAVSGKGSCRPLGNPEPAREALAHSKLSEEQRNAVEHLLTSPDRVMLLAGQAGTGKTTLTRAAVQQMENAGKPVVMLAPSAQASRGVLRDEGFTDADTLSRFLVDEAMQETAKDGVVWVDEAGLVGTKTMGKLFEIAKHLNSRVILAGDRFQMPSVERGAPLRVLETVAGLKVARVSEIRRQSGDYMEAVKLLARGKMQLGIDKLDSLGWIKQLDADGYDAVARDYVDKLRETRDREKGVLIYCATHAEGGQITQAVRETLKQEGLLDKTEHEFRRLVPLQWTQAQRSDTREYSGEEILQFHHNSGPFKAGQQVVASKALAAGTLPDAEHFATYRESSIKLAKGDVIRMTANGWSADEKAHRLNNGTVYTISGFTRDGAIKLKNGWTIDRNWGHVAHAITSTGYASQGRTTQHVIVVQSGNSHFAGGRESTYVAVSRGKTSATLFVDSVEELKRSAERHRPRTTAIELMQQPKVTMWKRIRDVMAQTRTASLLAAKAAEMQRPVREFAHAR